MVTRLGGRFQLVREIGGGGQAQVYQAVDTETGRAVAAKIMRAGTEDNLDALLRFQQEGTLLSTLKHPNIVEVYGTVLESQISYIIMELLEGQSLAAILAAQRLSLARVKHIAVQVASALAYAHQRDIIHRDVKPTNIMVLGDDHVKVTDFGIARILRQGLTLNTATGTSIGTPLYMPPEQIEGMKVDARADIYSLGAVLYRMVTDHPPFEGDDPLTVAFKHVHKAPEPPSRLRPGLPPAWEALILKTLAKNPDDRFQNAATLAEALTALPTDANDPAQDADRQFDVSPVLVPPPQADPATPPPTRQGRATPVPRPTPGEWADTQADLPSLSVPPARVAAPHRQSGQFRVTSSVVPEPVGAEDSRGPSDAPLSTAPLVAESRSTRRRSSVFVAVGTGAAVLALLIVAVLIGRSHAPSAPPPPPVVGQLTAAGVRHGGAFMSGASVRLGWKARRGAVYRLQIATAPADPSNAVVFRHPARSLTLRTNEYTVKVVGAQMYYWRVRAKLNGAWGKYSTSVFRVARPEIGLPAPLTPHDGTRTTASSVRLCWSGVSGALDYVLYLSGRSSLQVRSSCTWVSNLRPSTYRWSVAARVRGVQTYTGSASGHAFFTVFVRPRPTPRPTPTPEPAQPTAVPYTAPTAAPVQPYVPPTAVPQYVAPQPQPTAAPYVPPKPSNPAPCDPSLQVCS